MGCPSSALLPAERSRDLQGQWAAQSELCGGGQTSGVGRCHRLTSECRAAGLLRELCVPSKQRKSRELDLSPGFGDTVHIGDTLKDGKCVNPKEERIWSRGVTLFTAQPGETLASLGRSGHAVQARCGLSWRFGPPRQWGPSASFPPTPSHSLSLGTGSAPFSEQEDEAPPRPPLPELYSPEDQPPAVPPLPREATIIRHTSVRGLKRQSDERKRDREQGQCVNGDSRVSREDLGGALCDWGEGWWHGAGQV